jgi:hypothetical protein
MRYPAQERYDAKNMLRVGVAFNRKTEPEITARIEQEENKSKFIKQLVREQIEREKEEK